MVTLKESPTHPLSERSTTAIPDSIFHAADFLLGAGVVIIQPSTSKIVLVTDKRKRWFLPKGRKDKGESLEQTALREAYEEVNNRSFYLILFDHLFVPPFRVLMSKLTTPYFMFTPYHQLFFLIPSCLCGSCCVDLHADMFLGDI